MQHDSDSCCMSAVYPLGPLPVDLSACLNYRTVLESYGRSPTCLRTCQPAPTCHMSHYLPACLPACLRTCPPSAFPRHWSSKFVSSVCTSSNIRHTHVTFHHDPLLHAALRSSRFSDPQDFRGMTISVSAWMHEFSND